MLLTFRIIEFLLSIIFNLFCMLTLIRIYMQLAKVSFANPVGQTIIKLTNWLVLPLQRILPRVKGFDLPTFVAAYLCSLLHIFLLFLIGFWALQLAYQFSVQTFLLIAFAAVLNLIKLFIYMISAIIIIQVILSWIQPTSPSAWFVHLFTKQMSAPLLEPIQKKMPRSGIFAQIDFSPFIALLLLQLVLIIVTHFMPG